MKPIAALLVALLVGIPASATGAPTENKGRGRIHGRRVDDGYDIHAWRTKKRGARPKSSRVTPLISKPLPQLKEVVPACEVNDLRHGKRDGAMCPQAVHLCPTGGYMVWVLTTTTLNNPGPSDWGLRNSYCVRPGDDVKPGVTRIPVFTEEDFARLRLPAGGMHLEPDTGEVLVNMPTNLYVTAATIRRRTRLLDLDVEVEAVPTYYTWTFGDGERLETTDAGHPYPNMSTTHTYTQPGHYQVTLETTYTGSFRIAGDRTWIPIDGTVTIAGPPVTLEAYEARAVLVP